MKKQLAFIVFFAIAIKLMAQFSAVEAIVQPMNNLPQPNKAMTNLYTESFDSIGPGINGAPTGWIITSTDASLNWIYDNKTFRVDSGLHEEFTTPNLSLPSSNSTLVFDFWTYDEYHYYNVNELKIYLSNNNGASWNLIWNRQDSTMLVNSGVPENYVSETWYTATINLSAYNSQLVKIKFVYAESPPFSSYPFKIDNFKITQRKTNDLELKFAKASFVFNESTGCLWYSKIPRSQNIELVDSYSLIKNIGITNQTGVNLDINIEKDGSNVFSQNYSAFTSGSSSIEINDIDSFSSAINYTPINLGEYTVSYKLNQSQPDNDTIDNKCSFSFQKSSKQYSCHKNLSYQASTKSFPNSADGDVIYNLFEMTSVDTIKGISCSIGPNTTNGALKAVIYKWDTTSQTNVYMYESNARTVSNANSLDTLFFPINYIIPSPGLYYIGFEFSGTVYILGEYNPFYTYKRQYSSFVLQASDNISYFVRDFIFGIDVFFEELPKISSGTNNISCKGDNIELLFSPSVSGGTYKWLLNNQIITGQTSRELQLNNIQLSDSGMYACVDIDGDTALYHLTVFEPFQQNEALSICDGDSIFWHGMYYNSSGSFYDIFTMVNGCDSIYELELTVHAVFDSIYVHSICSGDSLYWRGNWYNSSGIYIDSYESVYGCDSSYTLDLTVNPIPTLYSVIKNPSNGILSGGGSGTIMLSWSGINNSYWTTRGGTIFTGQTSGTNSMLNFGSFFPEGTYEVWSTNEYSCTIKQGTATFINDNGSTKIVASSSYGQSQLSFADNAVEMTLFKEMIDINSDTVIVFEAGPNILSGGYINFDNLSDGIYYLKSELLDTTTYNTVIPIYFYDGPTVDSANALIINTGDIVHITVNHSEYSDTTGSNTAGGTVTDGGSKANGLPDQVVILRNQITGSILTAVVTNGQGYYHMNNVPDNSDLEIYVTSFEYQNWAPAGFSSTTNTHYTYDFVAQGDSVVPFDSTITAIKTIELNNLQIYPNPAQNRLYIENLPENATIKIFDIEGKLVLEDCRRIKSFINISSLKPGTYTFLMITDNEIGSGLFIKE